MKIGKLISAAGAILFLTSLLGISIGLYPRIDIGLYLITAGIGILSFILGLYVQIKNYLLQMNLSENLTYKTSVLSSDSEITDDDISDEIERHMEKHKH